jgi:hypothetical protein
LYSDLAERESKIRRLVDANIAVVVSDFEGQILETLTHFSASRISPQVACTGRA